MKILLNSFDFNKAALQLGAVSCKQDAEDEWESHHFLPNTSKRANEQGYEAMMTFARGAAAFFKDELIKKKHLSTITMR